jgi:hypothetical protein
MTDGFFARCLAIDVFQRQGNLDELFPGSSHVVTQCRRGQAPFRSRRLWHLLRPLLLWTIQQQGHMIENVSTQNAAICLDQQIPASECAR